MDDDDFRRGKETCHKKFGEDIALLAGDGLLTLAFQVIAESDNIEAVKQIAKTAGALGIIGGQVADILNKKSPFYGVYPERNLGGRGRETTPRQNLSREKSLDSKQGNRQSDADYINEKKTAALFEIAVRSGGIIKGADRRKIDALGDFGRDIGLAFQLLDDIKDRDGYSKLCGAGRTRQKADFLAKRAKNHLRIFGRKADVLLGLADLISSPT